MEGEVGRKEESLGSERHWADMMQEALVEIFSRMEFEDKYLNVPLVCKAWRRAVQDSACWLEVDIEPSFEKRRESDFWLSLEFEKRLESMITAVANWGSSRLRRLRTRHCSEHTVIHLSSRCPNLQSLHIQMSQGVTDEAISVLGSKCPQLESVDLSECRGISAEGMARLGESCKELTVLKRNMLDIEGNCRLKSTIPLRYLHLRFVPMGDEEAIAIANSMPHLKHLEMCYSTIQDGGLIKLAGSCTKLEVLDLRGCSYLTGRGLEDAEKKLPSSVHFKKPVVRVSNLQLERYGHWQLYDNRFSHQYLEF